MKTPKTKSPVLTTGTINEATIEPTKLFFFAMNLHTKPAKSPAKVHLSKQTTIVPKSEYDKNASVEGLNKTTKPFPNPNKAPAKGPKSIAPNAIGISDKLILTTLGVI